MKHLVAILLGELRAGVELHAERRDVRTELAGRRRHLAAQSPRLAKLRILDVPPWQYGKPKSQPGARRMIELARRRVLAEPVAAVVGEPELAAWPGAR